MIDFSLNADKKVVDEIKAAEQQRNMKERDTKVDYDFANRDSKAEANPAVEPRGRERYKLNTVANKVTKERTGERGGLKYERD